ncbi:MAG: hypothetical protein PVH53_16635, partial [Desulfobacterales bacterium]
MRRSGAHRHLNIVTRSELNQFAEHLKKQQIIGVDLEADSMYHFREKVCLIQIATRRTTTVIDPLQINNLSILKPVFKRADILKVF